MTISKNKKISIFIGGGIFALIVLGLVFYGGVEIGKKYYPSINLIEGLENKESGIPPDVDFSLFWDAWRIIQTDYLKNNDLDRQKMVYGAIEGLVDSLDDPHSVFFSPERADRFLDDTGGSFSGVGMEIGIRKKVLTIIAPLKGTPAYNAGLKAGDMILEIDGETTEDLAIEEAVGKIRGEKGTEVVLNIYRDSFEKPRDFSVIRDTIIIPSSEVNFLENNIAHLKLMNFNENAPNAFYNSALEIAGRNSSGIILDLRNNPGGYLEISVHIASWFLNSGEVVVRQNIKGIEEDVLRSSGNEAFSEVPIVILVNEGSASASEILAGALRDNRGVKMVGKKTFGKGSVQVMEKLFDDSMIKLTIAEWLTPNGISINNNGLEPDYEVDLPEDWQEGDDDPQLDKAVEILNEIIGR